MPFDNITEPNQMKMCAQLSNSNGQVMKSVPIWEKVIIKLSFWTAVFGETWIVQHSSLDFFSLLFPKFKIHLKVIINMVNIKMNKSVPLHTRSKDEFQRSFNQ